MRVAADTNALISGVFLAGCQEWCSAPPSPWGCAWSRPSLLVLAAVVGGTYADAVNQGEARILDAGCEGDGPFFGGSFSGSFHY